MDYLVAALQIIIALGIFNVWILRFSSPTSWRGGDARNMREEFAAYGLPPGVMSAVGAAKLLCAVGLLLGLWLPALIVPSASVLAVLMAVAIAMHFKVKDPLRKSLPAFTMLAMCVVVGMARGMPG